MFSCRFNDLTQIEKPELLETVALCTWQKVQAASLRENKTADVKTFLKLLRKYLEQYKAEDVAL